MGVASTDEHDADGGRQTERRRTADDELAMTIPRENASCIHLEKIAPSLGGHVVSLITTIKNNVLTKFHDDWPKNVTLRTVPIFSLYTYIGNCPPPGGHVFQMIMTIFELVRDIHKTNVLTNFNNDMQKRKITYPGGHETNVLTKCHEDWTKNMTSYKTSSPPGGHFHEDWATIVTSRVKTAPHPGGQPNILTNFELGRGIIQTNVLTKFHEDRTVNVALECSQAKMLTTNDGRLTKGDHKSSP
ncbi:hypothetical protein DPMN_110871 [Dreissena polymorpha]|uniref:Uncharacterized protein n=1 Tax=Dreissena polymorpha TaxID=45954 RepID=A0A9D4QPC5_DREPO|nr:hypothetical protein DPMN_110871 [Dreissena polymorpha]